DPEDAEDDREPECGQGVEPAGREPLQRVLDESAHRPGPSLRALRALRALRRFVIPAFSSRSCGGPGAGCVAAPGTSALRMGSAHIVQASDTGPKASAAGIVATISW